MEFGTPTTVASTPQRVASFACTALLQEGEKPKPPYARGMIMPRKRSCLMKSHAAGGRSLVTCTSQSRTMAHSSSTGPSTNACSAAVSSGYGSLIRRAKFGRPENSSPSTHTLPASMAMRSVSEMTGSSCSVRSRRITGRESSTVRSAGTLNSTASAAATLQSQAGAPHPSSASAAAAVHSQSAAPL